MLRSLLPGAFATVFLLCLTRFAVALTLGGGPEWSESVTPLPYPGAQQVAALQTDVERAGKGLQLDARAAAVRLLEAALRGGELALGRALAAERLQAKPHNGVARRYSQRAEALAS